MEKVAVQPPMQSGRRRCHWMTRWTVCECHPQSRSQRTTPLPAPKWCSDASVTASSNEDGDEW